MSELDLDYFLKEGSIANLDWLDVDEKDYRELDNLPKQNLDVSPDLEALWARGDEDPVKYVVPNKVMVPTPGIEDPKTMGDMSQLHGKLRAHAEEIRKVARLALVQSADLGRFQTELQNRFDLETLRANKDVLASVLKERGLLGRLYVAAEDFKTCATSTGPADFVRRYANDAQYVLAKTACGDCCHAKQSGGKNHCGVFHKEIQLEVPYSEELARAVERAQAGVGKAVQASETSDPRERIRRAYLSPMNYRTSDSYQGYGVNKAAAPALVDPTVAKEQLISKASLLKKKQGQLQSQPVVDFLHREMVKGLTRKELATSLKLAFDTNTLVATQDYWKPLFDEAGLYGVVYTKQASFSDCHVGADFLAKHNPSVRAVVAGDKCGSCVYNKASRCLMYGKSLVKEASEVLTDQTVEAVLWEHSIAGRLDSVKAKMASEWGNTPKKALKAIHAATKDNRQPQQASARMGFMEGFHGNTVPDHVVKGSTTRQIVKQAGQYLNEGLYGDDLKEALKRSFEVRDLVAAQSELRSVVAEQGLQGIYFVDPSVYDDYGKGCDTAARLHRSRSNVGYLKQASKCASCVHQTRLGYCSKINKDLVDEPPYTNKKAQQQSILASGKATEVTYASLVNNATSTLQEYEMQNGLQVDVKEASVSPELLFEIGRGKVKF